VLARALPALLALAFAAGCAGDRRDAPPPEIRSPRAAAPAPPPHPAPAAAAATPTESAPPVPLNPLYLRLGGQKAIEAVVDDFLPRVKADPLLRARFAGSNGPRLRAGLVAFLAHAAGGTQQYKGPSMRLAHRGMEVSDAEFDALTADLAASLEKLAVPEREAKALLAIVEAERKEIVERPPSLEDRLARIEAALAGAEMRADERLARIEADLERLRDETSRHGGRPIGTPEPAPAAPAVHAAPWTAAEKTLAEKWIAERYGAAKTASEGEPHEELVGRRLPATRFYSSSGEVVDLKSFEGKRKVVLVILRGFAGQVCLHCSAQTIALAQAAEKFRAKNAEVVLVYPGAAENVPAFVEAVENLRAGFTPPFPILLDVDLAAVRTFRILGSLAKPTSIIVDEAGTVRYAYVGREPADRPSAEDLLSAIDRIAQGAP
jgi:hemoglobin